jgi:CRISPR/Cas system-associated exonuclease Cas4 (RecB family)
MPLLHVETVLVVAAAVAALVGFLLLVLHSEAGRKDRDGARLLTRVVASDTGLLPPALLVDPVLGLRGKPDYFLEERTDAGRRLTPLEVKPTRRSSHLYESDALQLGAYLVASRAMFGHNASAAGYVHYANHSFRVELTRELEGSVRRAVEAIRDGRGARVARRSHAVPGRCRACAMRPHCDEKLQ